MYDYQKSGLTIQYAMVDHVEKFPDKEKRPRYILWGGLHVKTSDFFLMDGCSRVRGEFLSAKGDAEHGFDFEVDKGWIQLPNMKKVRLLRTWRVEGLVDIVEYSCVGGVDKLWVWNVYKMKYRGGQIMEEKWTENAGFWIEYISDRERIYHCSSGMSYPQDFESLVFKVTIA